MSLFKKAFGQKGEPAADPEAPQFDAEWERALVRFGIVTGLGGFKMNLIHPQTNQPMTPHEGLGATFAEWKQVRSAYDRRLVLFELLYNAAGRSMNAWQTANYLVACRRPDDALALLEEEPPPAPESADYAANCAAFAKACLGMTEYSQATTWAQEAVNAKPDDTHFQTVLADALHMSNQHEAAHAIYTKLMALAPGSTAAGAEVVAEMFANLFARETGVVSSPVLAIELGKALNDPVQSEPFWQAAETEFYDSPYFRMQHAYYLATKGALDRYFAKLVALVQEMPWVKEASLTLRNYFEQVDPAGTQILPEFQAQLRQTIEENGWTTEGMHETVIEVEQ